MYEPDLDSTSWTTWGNAKKSSISTFFTCGGFNKDYEEKNQMSGFNQNDSERITLEFLKQRLSEQPICFLEQSHCKSLD